jgi:hypothetical protein
MKPISPPSTTRRSERAAGAVLFATGAALALYTVVGLAPRMADLGSASPPVHGNAVMTLMIAGPVFLLVILATVACGWLLWRGRSGARTFAVAWILVGGLFAAQALAGFGNVLWAVRTAVAEPDRLLVRWPYLYWDPFLGSSVSGTPTESLPFGRLDDIAFWLPGVIAVAAVAVAVLLVAGRGKAPSGAASRDRGVPDTGI